MSKTRLLDLFCGAGGAAVGYAEAGFRVIGVDNREQPSYRFAFLEEDATQINPWTMALKFDAVHASPPCQKFSAYRRKGYEVGSTSPDLISQIRHTLELSGLPYVIENIPGSPLRDPIQLCGSSFGLDVRRHRLFESNIDLGKPPACDHAQQTPRFKPASNRTNLRSTVEVGVWRIPLAVQQQAMGIDWMTVPELSQAVPPAYTRWIGVRLLEALC